MTKGKKKALIITLSIVGVLVIAIAITCIVLFTRDPETPPEGGENTVYQTQPESFWQSFGSGYMSFDIIEEPAEPVEGELYGNVFKVYAFNEGEWQAWLLGTWEMSEDETILTLTATWDENNSNATKLTDATSGEPKVYTASEGKFSIGVTYPGMDGQVTFTLDPVADKVGEGETPKPPCTEHVDANSDGKCDNCGETMPAETPEEPDLMLTMTATDAATTLTAKIEMYDDNTFTFILDMMGGKVFGGTWASSDATGQNPMAPLTLTVDEIGSPVVGETITVTITPAADYSSMTYTCHVDYVVPDAIMMAFDFTGTFSVS